MFAERAGKIEFLDGFGLLFENRLSGVAKRKQGLPDSARTEFAR